MPRSAPSASPLQQILWGLFLASSWTWCIGMFLPIIMMDRWGWWGFAAFAAPNIAGVTLLGYLVRTRERSESIIARHAPAMRWFSIITIAYHMFFLTALAMLLQVSMWTAIGLIAGPFLAALLIAGLRMQWLLWAAAGLWCASLAVFIAAGTEPLAAVGADVASAELRSFIPVVPILIGGFLLCPWFDLTFHRVLREGAGPAPFAIFAPAFALMLLLTIVISSGDGPVWPSLALGHILWQATITMALHLREVRLAGVMRARPLERHAAVFAPLIGVATGLLASNSELLESLYLRFLVFYGLVFPAYALVFMHPRSPARRVRSSAIWFAIALVLCAPFYEIAFVHERTWWLLVPIAGAVTWLIARALPTKSARTGAGAGAEHSDE